MPGPAEITPTAVVLAIGKIFAIADTKLLTAIVCV
jgi:hypothetical protein